MVLSLTGDTNAFFISVLCVCVFRSGDILGVMVEIACVGDYDDKTRANERRCQCREQFGKALASLDLELLRPLCGPPRGEALLTFAAALAIALVASLLPCLPPVLPLPWPSRVRERP